MIQYEGAFLLFQLCKDLVKLKIPLAFYLSFALKRSSSFSSTSICSKGPLACSESASIVWLSSSLADIYWMANSKESKTECIF